VRQVNEWDTPEAIAKAIFLADLPEEPDIAVLQEKVKNICQKYGEVIRVHRPPNKNFCFVHFTNTDAVDAALADSIELDGIQLKVARRLHPDKRQQRGRGRGFVSRRGGRGPHPRSAPGLDRTPSAGNSNNPVQAS